jgi:hypothetical protein
MGFNEEAGFFIIPEGTRHWQYGFMPGVILRGASWDTLCGFPFNLEPETQIIKNFKYGYK